MTNKLKIPKENLLVILPPVNLDNNYSKSRLTLNRGAESFFRSIGVKVHPQVTGNAKDFSSDGYHILKNGELTQNAASAMMNSFVITRAVTQPSGRTGTIDASDPKQQIALIVTEEANKAGVDPHLALTIARMEGYNPKSGMGKSGGYHGLYQFGSMWLSEWEKYGMDWNRVHDTRHNAEVFMKIIKKKIGDLRSSGVLRNSSATNVDPNEAHLIYLAWQQGTSGTTQIAKAARSGARVSDRIQKNMDNNTYPKTPGITPAAFLEMWRGKTRRFGGGTRRRFGHIYSPDGSQPVAQVQPVAPAVDPTVTQAGLSTAGLTEVAKANNLKYFGNETGNSGKGYKSSRTFGKAYNFSLNNTVGSIPFTGDRRISSQWKADNLIVVGLPTPYILGGGPPKINKHLSTSLIRAVTESRAKYGLPLTHVGGFASKGKSGRFSSHAWGAAVDFDSVVNPFSRDGLMTRSRISSAIKNDKGYYQQFWYFKNPSTGQTYLDHLKESFANNTKALPLYIFVAGPAENNGIANIFEKNGWRWGGRWDWWKKDGMHFEYLPDRVRIPASTVAENKTTNTLLNLINKNKKRA